MSEQQQETQAQQTQPTTETTSTEVAATTTTPTPESKSTEGKEGETLLTKKDEKAPEGAPEKYEAYKLPENFVINEAQTTEVNALFKELNLPQASAQKLIDHYAKLSQASAQEAIDQYTAMRKQWQDEVKADKSLGDLKQVKVDVMRLVDSLGDSKLTEDFKTAMDVTGSGDNPAIVRVFAKLAKKYSEGSMPPAGGVPASAGKPNGQARPDAAHALFPNLP